MVYCTTFVLQRQKKAELLNLAKPNDGQIITSELNRITTYTVPGSLKVWIVSRNVKETNILSAIY